MAYFIYMENNVLSKIGMSSNNSMKMNVTLRDFSDNEQNKTIF